ncbi:uncharacterized protein BX663DRAFT_567941, partial [Cokeromyces recurvatus]|uniref:uncharacterized protein n=1 Tax=Cokeromyces recurvatus TaxID=90255 RepID=UPI00221EF0A9
KLKAINGKSWFHSLIYCNLWVKFCYLVSKLTILTIEVSVNFITFGIIIIVSHRTIINIIWIYMCTRPKSSKF